MNVARGLRWPLVGASVALLFIGGPERWALGAQERVVPHYQLASVQIGSSERPDDPLPDRSSPLVESRGETHTTADPRAHAPQPALLASIEGEMPITSRPGGGRIVGRMPAGSLFFDAPLKAWVIEQDPGKRFGRVTLPYSGTRATGWIRLKGLALGHTPYSVTADLSSHRVVVKRLGKAIMRFPAATGAAASPTPIGRYFVTDRVPITPGGSFGKFAFGLSGIQPNLPPGWTGGNQLAIHGTNDPGSIGTSASAGCLRVSSRSLDRLRPLLWPGTPVTIKR